VADPEAFVDYYANDIVSLASTSWLGPGYQVTSQVNVVNPGGAGQTVHRDYHLGFQSPKTSAEFPAHVHALSPVLTLQGAVAPPGSGGGEDGVSGKGRRGRLVRGVRMAETYAQ